MRSWACTARSWTTRAGASSPGHATRDCRARSAPRPAGRSRRWARAWAGAERHARAAVVAQPGCFGALRRLHGRHREHPVWAPGLRPRVRARAPRTAMFTKLAEYWGDGLRPVRPTPVARQGPRRRPLLRAVDRRRPRTRRRPVAGALQPRLPGRVRRVAPRLPAHAPARARRRAAAHHRPLGGRDLPRRRPAERRLVHDELLAHLRRVADSLPGVLPAGGAPRTGT